MERTRQAGRHRVGIAKYKMFPGFVFICILSRDLHLLIRDLLRVNNSVKCRDTGKRIRCVQKKATASPFNYECDLTRKVKYGYRYITHTYYSQLVCLHAEIGTWCQINTTWRHMCTVWQPSQITWGHRSGRLNSDTRTYCFPFTGNARLYDFLPKPLLITNTVVGSFNLLHFSLAEKLFQALYPLQYHPSLL